MDDQADEGGAPIESARGRRGRLMAIAVIAVFCVGVVSYLVWCLIGLVTLGNTDEGAIAVAYRLVGVPALGLALAAAIVGLVDALLHPRGLKERVVAAILVVLAGMAFWMFAVTPLLDVPYLLEPVRVELHDVSTRCFDGEQSATYYLDGVDDAGKKWEFRINGGTYYGWDPARTTATVTGLPHTQVTLSIE